MYILVSPIAAILKLRQDTGPIGMAIFAVNTDMALTNIFFYGCFVGKPKLVAFAKWTRNKL